ncbi:RcnB family protein [Rhodoferax sp.]|uniref:RcnB family protein n=1 Tax=Rhodoferax sp. TaxID=50421 RepID=UPI00374C9324
MKKTLFVATVMAASMAFSGLASAQNGHGGEPNRDNPELLRRDQQGRPDVRHDNRGPDRQAQQFNRRDDHGRDGRNFAQERGAGPDHNFRRGGRLPTEYRNRQYVVDDWRGHHLSAPPRGYHWVQTGGDYVLIAITTGIIAQILLGNY